MQSDLSNVPDLGLLGIVLHRVMKRAKSKYEEFDLNRSQASILFTLHQRSFHVSEGTGGKPEYDSAVYHFRYQEDGTGRLYQEEAG